MTRVLLVDDHPIVLQGCRRVLEDSGVREIVEASSTVNAYRQFRRSLPDTVIVDLALNGNRLGGLDLIRRMRLQNRRVPILVLSMHTDPHIVSRALEAGATGYVLKDAGPADFLTAFQTVRAGKPYLNHEIAVQVAMLGPRREGGLHGNLSPRELQTLALLAEGKPYGEIAQDLNVSYKTIANSCSQLKEKLGARNLPELIRMAIQYVSDAPEQQLSGVSRRG
jgi:Response regulator containing a CheY-like receiver domain and an HTH DNA-binding domain